MRAILVFRLPSEAEEHKAAQDGMEWKGVAWGLDRILRSYLTYGHYHTTADQAIEGILNVLHADIVERGLQLEWGTS